MVRKSECSRALTVPDQRPRFKQTSSHTNSVLLTVVRCVTTSDRYSNFSYGKGTRWRRHRSAHEPMHSCQLGLLPSAPRLASSPLPSHAVPALAASLRLARTSTSPRAWPRVSEWPCCCCSLRCPHTGVHACPKRAARFLRRSSSFGPTGAPEWFQLSAGRWCAPGIWIGRWCAGPPGILIGRWCAGVPAGFFTFFVPCGPSSSS